MNIPDTHPLQPFWQIAVAPIQGKALEMALTLGLFDRLETPTSLQILAGQFNLNPDNTQVWLDLLWSMALLKRETTSGQDNQPYYQTSWLSQRYFTEKSEQNCSQAWRFRYQTFAQFSMQMNQQIQSSQPQARLATLSDQARQWADAAQVQIAQEQQAVTAPLVPQLLSQLTGLPAGLRFLDLGGGPGFVAMAIARLFPGSSGTVFDLPESVAVASRNIAQAGLSKRLHTLGGNLEHDEIGQNYDLIWCSSVLHFMSAPDQALQKIVNALKPGGMLVCAHAEKSNQEEVAAKVLPYYLPMMMRGKYVPEPGEIKTALSHIGLTDLSSLQVEGFPMAPIQVHYGRKE